MMTILLGPSAQLHDLGSLPLSLRGLSLAGPLRTLSVLTFCWLRFVLSGPFGTALALGKSLDEVRIRQLQSVCVVFELG